MANVKDYYKILEVGKNASADEIKNSFRRLAKLYHPDKNPNDKTLDEKFKEINIAHEVLSDRQKRKDYDYSLSNVGKAKTDMPTPNDSGVNDILNAFDNFKF